MATKPITLGAMICTVVDPHPGHARAYNRWYEEDHLYATLLGPGAFAGARFLARRSEKAARPTGVGSGRGSLLALYWLVGDGTEHAAFRATNRVRLAEAGRLYAERDMVLAYTGTSAFAGTRSGVTVPPELALDHRFGHLVLSIFEADPRPAAELAQAYAGAACPAVLGPGSPVAVVTGFVAERQPDPSDRLGGVPGTDLFVVWFCDAEPTEHLASLAALEEAAGVGAPAWRSPFVATVVGTDTHLDDLGIDPG
jgi:hypothetical protein